MEKCENDSYGSGNRAKYCNLAHSPDNECETGGLIMRDDGRCTALRGCGGWSSRVSATSASPRMRAAAAAAQGGLAS